MAAEVPAKDVLCEAMEYLTKLGSNLRTRSESLRNKRIRREKLNNVLAVQKAASKVLLICQLSKKSLENVESGVRKILQHIDTSQATSNGSGNRSDTQKVTKESNDQKSSCYYIKYKSRKLRIKNRISFKHYNSVRVYAKSLPKSVMDKYPVHYDCKLYRMRKKQTQLHKLNEQVQNKTEERGDVTLISIPDTSNPKSLPKASIENDNVLKDVSIISIPDSPDPKITDSAKSYIDKGNRKLSVEVIEHSSDKNESPRKHKSEKHSSNTERKSSEVSRTEKNNALETEIDGEKEETKKSSKRKQVISDDSSGDDRGDPKTSNKFVQESVAKKKRIDKGSDDVMKPHLDENITENDKDSDTASDSKKPMIKCVNLSTLLKPEVLVKEKTNHNYLYYKPRGNSKELNSKQKEYKGKQDKNSDKNKREEQEYWAQKRNEISTFKPKSFVISVTRLPELSHNYLSILSLKRITQGGLTVCEITDADSVKEQEDDNNDDSAGKSQKTIANRPDKLSSRQGSFNSDQDDDLIAEANKVKNFLLNESDSEDSISLDNKLKSSKTDTEIIKNALLNDSDSDNNKSDDSSDSSNDKEKDKDSVSEADQAKKPLCIQSDSTKDGLDNGSSPHTQDLATSDKLTNNITSKNGDDNHDENSIVKDSEELLIRNEENLSKSQIKENEKTPEKKMESHSDSSDDETKTPLSKRFTPQSKKKRMRESVHAKKMLLTYSSSDTEDEQLSNALKEIKKSLLHGSDDENKEEKRSRESSRASSEDITIKKNKMKKKHNLDSKRVRNTKYKKNRKAKKNVRESEDSDSSVDSKSSNIKMVRSKSKPGNSSCQNSDGPDSNDKDIDGLTNMKTLQQSRRRNSSESEETIITSNTRSKSKPKPTGLISEEMLKAESSSDSAEASADEIMDNTDLQEVTVPSFNGVSDHLEKENLLGESDSSVSHNADETSGIKVESDSDENPNAKRRKAVLSSDSEEGSSRKKNNDASVKMSDFEDSDDSVNNKRNKRKKKAADSDASVGSVSSLDEGKKKRRRIRSVKDSDASDSESETEGRNKHGRKNIRKVMGKNQLEEATKKAAREEKERIARIAERQKIYNNLEFDESGKPDEVVLDKVILDFDPETKEPLIEVDRGLVKKLKPHQANGIKFMWNACFESVKRIKKDKGSGCILAHCMGLGKTLQVVTLTHTLLTHGDLTSVNRVLVVCPLSTVLNWVNEFRMWLKYAETEYDVEVFELSRYKQNSERAFQLSQWYRHGGVCVLGYEMFRNLSADNSKKYKKKMLKNFQEALVDPGPDLVVCDEGHLLKNEKTSLSQSMNKVKTYRRIVLTGTPLQNNLKEYYCMVQFVKPNLLGKYNEYLNRFVNPITNGQYTDSTEHDIKIMKRRSHVLHKMLDGAVQRRDYGVLAPFLPPKHEYVLFITLAEVQTKLYQHYLDNFSRKPLPGKSSGFLFPDFQSLQRIWTHPLVLKYNSERYEIMQQKKRDKEEEEDSEGSLRDFIDDDSTSEDSMSDDSTDDSSDVSDDSRKKSKKKKKANKKSKGKDKDGKGEGGLSRPRRGTRANPVEINDEDKEDDVIEMKYENPTEWWIKLVTEDVLEDMRNSHKLVLLFDILRQCEAIGDKLLVFSQSLYSLDLIEHFLGKVDDATQEGRIDEKLGGHIGTWSPGVDYFRLDGSTSCENRSIWCKNFNREDNPRARLFLISTRAGGLGINLVAANRVVIFDVSWNPSHDVQSIFRVYRFGQKKPCYVYRFLAMGTMEEKIYERQVTKQAISKRVIDEQQIDRHYAENDLAELYKFEPQPPTPRPIPPLPKDRLFAEMLREHEVQIYKYHEHDSLLENKEEETLSEEERKAAWEDFENEKNKPPPAPFPSAWQANMLQQQQLTYAALAAMLRKDMPNVSDNQLRDMIPLIYNANPQLMQKLSEIYKYSPAMMNPGMMNPAVMNPVAAGGMGGLGGASGLQYEPPWQRQHQQQQQMRLQQLLQQQNPMGAKFYAGGLGSRDPVAMALQHQRAREIMMGNSAGGAGRPRGRPPMQPRAPPTGDVVNLDSD